MNVYLRVKKHILDFVYGVAKYFFGIQALDAVPKIVKHESLSAAILYLKRRYRIFRPAPVRFLLKLYRYILFTAEDLPVFQEKNTFIIHFCCWGESYGEKVKNYFLPSLLSVGNLPAIAKDYKTTLLIHCDLKTKNKLDSSVVLKQVKKYASIKFIVFPKSLVKAYDANFNYPNFLFFKKIIKINANIKYFLLGALQTQALEIAVKNKSYISFCMPDTIISDMFLTRIFAIAKDKKVVAGSTFRINYQKVAKKLESFFLNEEKTTLTISAPALIDLLLNNMHAISKSMVVSESTLDFMTCAQLLFKTPHGFILRTFHYHPLLLDCHNYDHRYQKDYCPIDNTILNEILVNDVPFDQQVIIADARSEIAFVELSDENVSLVATKLKKLSYKELVCAIYEMILKSPDTYNTSLNRYFGSIQNKFESTTIQNEENFISDDIFFSDLKACLQKRE